MTEFDSVYANYVKSEQLADLFGRVFDPELPREIEAFSFVPMAGLRAIASLLRVQPGELLVDLACGRGGPGLWVARTTQARLLGVDLSSTAVSQATSRIGLFGLDGRASFQVGALAATGLPDASADAVMCVDSIHFAPDLDAVAAETFRILKPGRRLVLTDWERGNTSYADILRGAGLDVLEVREYPEWEDRRRATYQTALSLPSGDDPGLASLQNEARRQLPSMPGQVRVLLVCARTAGRGRSAEARGR